MEPPGRIPADGVVDLGCDRDLDLAVWGIDLLDFQCTNWRTVVVDRRSDVAVSQIEYFALSAHGDVKRPGHHVRVQLDIRRARGLWFHSSPGFKIIAAMLGVSLVSERSRRSTRGLERSRIGRDD